MHTGARLKERHIFGQWDDDFCHADGGHFCSQDDASRTSSYDRKTRLFRSFRSKLDAR